MVIFNQEKERTPQQRREKVDDDLVAQKIIKNIDALLDRATVKKLRIIYLVVYEICRKV